MAKPFPGRQAAPKRRASGFAFLLFMLALGIIAGGILLIRFSEVTRARETSAGSSLEEARNALIGFAVREVRGGNGFRLGNFPHPDSFGDGAYDGNADINNLCLTNGVNGLPASTTPSANRRCIGKVPWKELGIGFGTTETHDPLGAIPWMAISANLAWWDQCLEKFNSDILNWSYAAFACPAGANALPYPWLTVRDETGAVLSNRVAAVIILPGPPISTETRTQSRTAASPGHPSDYLDNVSVPLGCVTCSASHDNAGLNNAFIRIAPGTRYPDTAENATLRGQPVPFNDRLTYITIDELVPLIEKRVLSEMSAALVNFSKLGATPIGYPWAVTPTSVSSYSDLVAQPLARVGHFPFSPDLASSTPPFGYPAGPTELTWNFSAAFPAPARDCKLVSGSWINTMQRIRNNTQSVSAPLNLANCTWKGPSALNCTGSIANATPTDSFTRYGTQANCLSASSSIGTANYTRTKTLNFVIDATCSGTLTHTYLTANATQTQRRQWACTAVAGTTTFNVNVSETFAGGVVGSTTLSGTGRNVTVVTRYYPLMPSWFYGNDWHLTAYYALAPAMAPAGGSTDCGGATALTAGGNPVANALVMLAGSRLPTLPATPTQTRPSGTLTNYFEGTNATGFSNCAFGATEVVPNATANDRLFQVTP